jgi:hypothetical protein
MLNSAFKVLVKEAIKIKIFICVANFKNIKILFLYKFNFLF